MSDVFILDLSCVGFITQFVYASFSFFLINTSLQAEEFCIYNSKQQQLRYVKERVTGGCVKSGLFS